MAKRSVPVTRGSLSHLIVPQSKTWVSTAAGVTKRRPAKLGMVAPFLGSRLQILETSYPFGDGKLGRQAFDARGAKKSADALGSAKDVLCIRRIGDRTTMTEDQDLGLDGDRCLLDGLNALNRLIERDGGSGTDGSLCRQAHVCDQEVRAGFRHGPRFVFVEGIGAGEQIQFMGTRNHLDLQSVSHTGFL